MSLVEEEVIASIGVIFVAVLVEDASNLGDLGFLAADLCYAGVSQVREQSEASLPTIGLAGCQESQERVEDIIA